MLDSFKDLKNFKIDHPFISEVDSMSLRCSLFNLDNSFQLFFKEGAGFSKFKSYNRKNSYRTNIKHANIKEIFIIILN